MLSKIYFVCSVLVAHFRMKFAGRGTHFLVFLSGSQYHCIILKLHLQCIEWTAAYIRGLDA